jgi:hypothetical protein
MIEDALRNDVPAMKAYLIKNAPLRCRCVNNGDLCGRCEVNELINQF